jgi:hypothetical protein
VTIRSDSSAINDGAQHGSSYAVTSNIRKVISTSKLKEEWYDVQLLMERNMEMLHLGIFTFSSGREAKKFKQKFEGGGLIEIEKPGNVGLRVYIVNRVPHIKNLTN